METIVSKSEEETVRTAARFSGQLKRGDVIALYGDLGSGKTRFAKGIAAGLGVKEQVTSPTFVVVNEHRDGRLPVYHFDFYRLRSAAELDEIGYDEYIYGDGVCILEWADMIKERLPDRRFDVRITPGKNEYERIISIGEQ